MVDLTKKYLFQMKRGKLVVIGLALPLSLLEVVAHTNVIDTPLPRATNDLPICQQTEERF